MQAVSFIESNINVAAKSCFVFFLTEKKQCFITIPDYFNTLRKFGQEEKNNNQSYQ